MSYILDKTGLEVQNQLTTAIGGIHNHDNSTSQTIASGLTYTKVINFADPNDGTININADSTNNRIIIEEAGYYKIDGSFSFSSGTNNINVLGTVFINNLELNSTHFKRKISTIGDTGSASLSDTKYFNEGDEIDFRTRHTGASDADLTFEYMNLNLIKIGI